MGIRKLGGIGLVLLAFILLGCSQPAPTPSPAPTGPPASTTAAPSTTVPATTAPTSPSPKTTAVTPSTTVSPSSSPASSPTATPVKTADKWVYATSENAAVVPEPGIGYNGVRTQAVHMLIWENLTTHETVQNPDGTLRFQIVPVLASGYRFVDNTHLRFKLKKGIKFQNGDDFTAEDVKYTFDYYKKMPLGGTYRWSAYLSPFSECNIIDPYTVEFVLPQPNIDALVNSQAILIMPKARGFTKESVAAFDKNPVGTGPYKVTSFKQDQSWELEAWDGFRDGVVSPKSLTVKYIPESSTRLAAMLAGEVNLMEYPAPEHLQVFKTKPEFDVFSGKGARVIYYLFQFLKPNSPFAITKVRQAVNYAVDKDAIVSKILEGGAMVTASTLFGGWQGAIPDLKPYPYDPKKARQLLAEAGYPSGFETDIITSTGESVKDSEITQTIQSYLADIGIKAKLRPMEIATRYDLFYKGDFTMMICEWSLTAATSWKPLKWNLLFYDQMKNTPGAVMPSDVAQVKALWDKVQVEMDPAKQEPIFRQINQLQYDNAMNLFLYAHNLTVAYNKTRVGANYEVVYAYNTSYPFIYNYRAKYPANRKIVLDNP